MPIGLITYFDTTSITVKYYMYIYIKLHTYIYMSSMLYLIFNHLLKKNRHFLRLFISMVYH